MWVCAFAVTVCFPLLLQRADESDRPADADANGLSVGGQPSYLAVAHVVYTIRI